MRWLSIGVILYMILGIIWWGFLLHSKNKRLYDLRLAIHTDADRIEEIQKERSRQNMMIIGEGIFLGFSLLLGVYIINRSALREITTTRQQNNFLLSVSHELKSPIAAIKLAFQTLNKRKLTVKDQNDIINSGIQDVNRLNKMVQNILVSAKMDGTQLELYEVSFNFTELIQRLKDAYQSEFPELTFRLHVPEKPIWLKGDQSNIQLAINNVLDNAVKYSDHAEIEIRVYKEDENAFCRISNYGPAIQKMERELIYTKFYRGKNPMAQSKEGTGLGLYISNQIILAHRGKIELKSTDGVNEFTISIPIHE